MLQTSFFNQNVHEAL